MAKRELEPDYIKWVLQLDSSQAQQEYHKLEKDNKELQKQMYATRKRMSELAAQGKKGSEEWKNLSTSIREDSRVVAENTAKMNEVAKRFDLATMSVTQLRKRLNE